MSNNIKIAIASFLGGFLLGVFITTVYIHYTTPHKVDYVNTEVDEYKYKEIVKELEALKAQKKEYKTKDSIIIKTINEIKYVPLPRPVVTDSLSRANIKRFYY